MLLLTGGDKSSQQADIKRAGKLWAEWQRRQRDEKFKASRSHHAEVGTEDVGLKVVEHAREHDVVYKVQPSQDKGGSTSAS